MYESLNIKKLRNAQSKYYVCDILNLHVPYIIYKVHYLGYIHVIDMRVSKSPYIVYILMMIAVHILQYVHYMLNNQMNSMPFNNYLKDLVKLCLCDVHEDWGFKRVNFFQHKFFPTLSRLSLSSQTLHQMTQTVVHPLGRHNSSCRGGPKPLPL